MTPADKRKKSAKVKAKRPPGRPSIFEGQKCDRVILTLPVEVIEALDKLGAPMAPLAWKKNSATSVSLGVYELYQRCVKS